MLGFLVRLILGKDLVGLFFARNFVGLIILIDECTEPEECEFTLLPPGSVYWPGPAVRLPIRGPDDLGAEDDGIPWSGASISESWWSLFFTRKRWTPIDPERAAELRQQKPKRKPPKRKSAKVIAFRPKRPTED